MRQAFHRRATTWRLSTTSLAISDEDSRDGPPGNATHTASVTVVVCAYALDRWQLLCAAIESVHAQTVAPHEMIVCVDHNPDLARRCRERWSSAAQTPIVRVVENRYPGHLGSARNTAVELATGDIVAFLDDDCRAAPDWLEHLLASYAVDARTMAIGGAPLPHFEVPRPGWLPFEFDWVFGCTYLGVPTRRSKTRRLIGANMSVRRKAILTVGGFHADHNDDMDLSHRIAHYYGDEAVVFDPSAIVTHFVSRERVTWAYFWHRCFQENKAKVRAFRDMADAGSLMAESVFAAKTIGLAVPKYLATGTKHGLLRALVALAGIALAAAGHLTGRIELALGKTDMSPTLGLAATLDTSRQPPL
jgi:glycosyltransferase involved in cell wall biosynthesis